ncbi:hypothetical protein CGLO_14236 [Colletotrichum gloeosporioides Cg-14]|uniref:Uncharacterized protein n=1 Tax=Colletotrichum gloeosporioides (strain Cg-14) TaxID=1237896 RepID=T0L572_COLGC|nr:hypothetical protein CGLO_14236 [Colletotrichum gloeosporioides Cg-14]
MLDADKLYSTQNSQAEGSSI